MDDDDDNNVIPLYLVFVPPTNPKHTNFVKGMLFISLEQFKNAVTNCAVHGGWGIRFKKNDKIRVREICQDGCKWIAKEVDSLTCPSLLCLTQVFPTPQRWWGGDGAF